MADKIAQDIIAEWNREDSDASNVMSSYQSQADHFLPRENNITTQNTPGDDKSLPIIDGTGRKAFQKMTSGLSAVFFPPGQYFCRLSPQSQSNVSNNAIVYLNRATDILHNELFKPACNFILEINESIVSWAGFGTCDIQSLWDKEKLQLTFRDWDVSNFRFGVDASGYPNRCLIRWQYTAQQAFEKWGEKAGEKIVACMNSDDAKKSQETFWFIWRVQPRSNRSSILTDTKNYRFEEIVANETEKVTVDESGYKEFPHHISRWLTSSQEKWGYGQFAFGLSIDKELQVQKKALNLCADLQNKPPYQTSSSFEGTPKIYPGANNRVMEMDSVKPLAGAFSGNFPITKDTLEMTRDDIRDVFLGPVFAPLDNLTGDRRTQLEIQELINAGYRQMVLPAIRFYNECLTPCVERCVHILHDNHRFDELGEVPEELGNGFKVEYLGRLALAIQEQQSDALQRFAQFSMTMDQVVPNFTSDTINSDRAGRRMATTFGVNESDLNTDEEKAAIREKRQQDLQEQKEMMAMQAAGKAYKDGSGAAEAGSPSEALMAEVS